jgi:hypothetical protein
MIGLFNGGSQSGVISLPYVGKFDNTVHGSFVFLEAVQYCFKILKDWVEAIYNLGVACPVAVRESSSLLENRETLMLSGLRMCVTMQLMVMFSQSSVGDT